MMVSEQGEKRVYELPLPKSLQKETINEYRQKRVIAYCRVSTKQEEQLNSYETQRTAYVEMINKNPDWKLVRIFADKGISGTSVKNRDEFNKMIKLCKQGKADMIITKSISRFARNTEDCLHYTRLLKQHNVDVYFEEQKIHSTQPGAEFYITIYGSIAQSESENISANVKWGKTQSAKQGKVAFKYKNFLGYKRGEDGKPVIDIEQADVIKFIYDRFLSGDSLIEIAKKLEDMKILSPGGKQKWQCTTVRSILSNERYKGDAIINKTYVVDCISKKVKVNNGERKKYYVSNSHPAIIDAEKFARVQEELARRAGKHKVKQYCHNSPTIEESVLHEAIMEAIQRTAQENIGVLQTLKEHISMGLSSENKSEDTIDIEFRIAEIDSEFKAMIDAASAETMNGFDENRMQQLIAEKNELQAKLGQGAEAIERQKEVQSRLDTIYAVLDGLKNHPMVYDDETVRQLLERVVVESKDQIKIVFRGGLQVEQQLRQEDMNFLSEMEQMPVNI